MPRPLTPSAWSPRSRLPASPTLPSCRRGGWARRTRKRRYKTLARFTGEGSLHASIQLERDPVMSRGRHGMAVFHHRIKFPGRKRLPGRRGEAEIFRHLGYDTGRAYCSVGFDDEVEIDIALPPQLGGTLR